MKDKIVVIGSNEHQNPLILKAKEMGYETHVFAWQMGDIGESTADFYYPISITNKQAILKKCREIEPKGIVSMASDLAAVTVGYLTNELRCTGNETDTIEICTNKIMFRNRMRECGIDQPEFVEVGDVFPEENIQKLHFPVVVKPSNRSGNRGVVKAGNRKNMIRALNLAKEYSFERKAIIEEYIAGDYYSCECLSENGRHTIVALTKRNSIENNNLFLDYERIQTAELKADNEIEKTVLQVLDAVKFQNGASSVEFIKNDQGIWVIEAMPSMYGDYIGSHLVPQVLGVDYLERVIEIACGVFKQEENISKESKMRGACVRFVLSRKDYNDYERAQSEGRIIHSSKFDEGANIPDEISGVQYGFFIEKME